MDLGLFFIALNLQKMIRGGLLGRVGRNEHPRGREIQTNGTTWNIRWVGSGCRTSAGSEDQRHGTEHPTGRESLYSMGLDCKSRPAAGHEHPLGRVLTMNTNYHYLSINYHKWSIRWKLYVKYN